MKKSNKKTLTKYQSKGEKKTPFQKYMAIPGAVASDTIMTSSGGGYDAPLPPNAKNPKLQPFLEDAFIKTYGIDYLSPIGKPPKGETMEQFRRRMGPLKNGGTKMMKGGQLRRQASVNGLRTSRKHK